MYLDGKLYVHEGVRACVGACINKGNIDGQIPEIALRLGNWQ